LWVPKWNDAADQLELFSFEKIGAKYSWLRSSFSSIDFNCFYFAKVLPIDLRFMVIIGGTQVPDFTGV
jgi:hypothetical protein